MALSQPAGPSSTNALTEIDGGGLTSIDNMLEVDLVSYLFLKGKK
jgi:hypothetical protein